MTYLAAVLLLVAALAHIAPEHVSAHFGGTHAAWETVGYSFESAMLWGVFLVAAVGLRGVIKGEQCAALFAVSLFGVSESLQRMLGRLAFPLDRPAPRLPGKNLLDIATGYDISSLSLVAIGAVSVYIWGANAGR